MRRSGGEKSRKSNGGFTLVELIVVLVILGILAAIMVPSLIGWIDKAKNQDAILECRSVVLAAQGQLAEEYARGVELGPAMESQLESMRDEIHKLAGVTDKGFIKAGSIKAPGNVISELDYETNNKIVVKYKRGKNPDYWIDAGGYTGKTGKDHTESLTDKLDSAGIIKDGQIQKDKLDEWLEKTGNKNLSNSNDSRAIQEYFLDMMGSESFPAISAAEKNKLTNLLGNYNPPLSVTDTLVDTLSWKPVVTSDNKVILVAGTKNEKGNTNGAFIYYNGNYYGKLNYNGNGITTISVTDTGFDTSSLNDTYVKNGWVEIGN